MVDQIKLGTVHQPLIPQKMTADTIEKPVMAAKEEDITLTTQMGKLMNGLITEVSNHDEQRRIAETKMRIDNNTYDINVDALTDKLVGNSLIFDVLGD